MAFALGAVAAFALLVAFGAWVLQAAIGVLSLCLRLLGWIMAILFGLVSLAALALLDREQLLRILRNERAHAANAALLARERWS